MEQSTTLPFALNPEAVANWLLAFERLPVAEKINRLYRVLNDLADAPADKPTLFLVLDKLTESVLLLSKLLEHHAQKLDDGHEKAGKWMAAALQLPKKLGQTYAQLAKDSALEEAQRLACAYRAMQILNLVGKRGVLFHEPQDPSLWKRFAELYLLASARHWLTQAIDDPVPGLMAQPTIEAVVKHALLFHGCHPYHHEAAGITAIFAATAALASIVGLSRERADFTLCRWRPEALLPPETIDPDKPLQFELTLDTGALSDYFDSHADKRAQLGAFPGVLDRLTAYYDIRRTVDPIHAEKCSLILGSQQAAKFLNLLISRYRVMELSGLDTHKPKAMHLELVPLEIRNTLASMSSTLLADVTNVSANQLTMFPTRERAFSVINLAHLKCSQDEAAIVIQENSAPYFAVVRHIRADPHASFRSLLLERIDGEVYPVEIAKQQGFIIRPGADRAELILPPTSRHVNAAVLTIDRGIIDALLKIERLVESGRHFARYQVSFIER